MLWFTIIITIMIIAICLWIVVDDATNLSLLDRIYDFLRINKLRDSIYVDVYSDTNDITTGRDTRLAIVRPFNWYILNSQSHVYVNAMATYNDDKHYCRNGGSKFIKLNNPSAGEQALQHIYVVCLPFTVSSLLVHFMNKPRTRIYMDEESSLFNGEDNTVTIIDIINSLLSRGVVINHLLS